LLNAGYPVSGSVVIAAQGRDTSQLAARLRQNLAAAAAEMGSACQMALSTLPAHAGLILRLHSRDAQSASHIVRSVAETVRSEFARLQLQ
jgi:urease accessory protein UreH